MAEFYHEGDCIDGKKVLVKSKKPTYVPTFKESPTGFKGIKYKCSRDGYSEIVSVLSEEQINVAKDKKKDIHTDEGDSLKCEQYYFIVETKKKIDFEITMMSGRHECHTTTTKYRAYVEIEKPFSSIFHAAQKKLLELKEATILDDNGNKYLCDK